MAIVRRHLLHWAALVVGMISSAGPVAGKAPPGQEGEKRPGAAASRPALKKLTYKVKQPAEFVALAEKARRLKGVYAKGTMEIKGPKDIPPEGLRLTFQTWTTPTAARAVTAGDGRTETIVYDGKYAYSSGNRSGREGRGSRRKVTEERYYDDLEVASPSCDAARGYTNLGNVATFRPIPPDGEFGKRVPGLKWFQVVPAKTPPEHTFIRRMGTLKVGFNTADGLVRVVLAETSSPSGPDGQVTRMQMAVVFAQVRHVAIKAGDLKLPPEAAKAEWRDRDSGKKVEPPSALIARATGGKQGEKRTGKPRIALIMKSLANEFFKTVEDGARAHQKAHSSQYDLVCNGLKDERDVARQIELVENMIAQAVDAIVIAPANSKALVPVCRKAQRAGIIVVNIDSKFDTKMMAKENVRIPFVGPDNRRGARMAGDYLAKKLKKGDKVAIVEGVLGSLTGIQRKLGFEDAMKAAGMKIVSSQTGNWRASRAEQVVANMIAPYPDLKAVLCANDVMALGAVAALKSAGKLGQVLVIGYDNIPAVRKLVKEGKVLCTIDQHADRMAVYGIEFALMILGVVDKDTVDKATPVHLVTAEKLK